MDAEELILCNYYFYWMHKLFKILSVAGYEDHESYPMSSQPCGIALIINQRKFDDPKIEERAGTDRDRGLILVLFLR